MALTLTSSAFGHNEDMPVKYTCEGDNTSPPLEISGVPEGAKSLVLLNDDPDAPDPAAPKFTFDHWVLFNIDPATTVIQENTSPGLQGLNGRGNQEYTGPCPPIGKHRYFFKLYALDTELDLSEGVTKADVENAMEGHVLAQVELIGLYEKA